jgi:uncharacterized protein YndB with AHSA1/START domain
MRMSDLPSCEVSARIAAAPETVWALVSDVTRVGQWGAECVAAQWIDGASGPAPGARFLGQQVREDRKWETTSVVIEAEPGRTLEWVVGDPDNPSARWRYELTADDSGTLVTYRVVMGPGPSGLTAVIAQMPDHEERIIDKRLGEHRQNMTRTLAAIKAVAEGS